MNDTERKQWVDNDFGLYAAWKASREPQGCWVKENRAYIDAAINRVLNQQPVLGSYAKR